MKRALTTVGVVIGVLLLVWAAAHVMLTQINPEQAAPKGHFGEPCWACHLVNSGADLIEE